MKITKSGDVTIIIAADDQTKEAIEAAKKRLGELGNKTESALDKMKTKWLAMVGVMYTVKKAFDFMQSAAGYHEQLNRMDAYARAYGTTAQTMLNELKNLTNGQIANADLVAVSTESMLRRLKPDQIKEFSQYVNTLADDLGIKGVEAFRAMTEAAVSGRGMWKIGALEAKDLDAALGKQAETMSANEKMQARVTLMLKIMSQQYKATGQSVESVSDKFEKWNATLMDWKEIAGTILVKLGAGIVTIFTTIGGSVNFAIGNILVGLGKLIEIASKMPGGSVISKMFGGAAGARSLIDTGEGFLEGSKYAAKMALESWNVARSFGEIDNKTKATIPQLKENVKALQDMESAQAQWNAQVEAMNPLMDEYDKKIININKSMFELTQKYGNAAWIKEGHAKALSYIELDEKIKSNEAKQKLIDAENEYQHQKYTETIEKMKQLDEQYIELKKTQYEQGWNGIMEMINQTGGEEGAALGQAASHMKGIADVSAGIDPYSQQMSDLLSFYDAKTTAMEEQMYVELYFMEQQGASEIEMETFKRQQKAAINAQWDQWEIEQENLKSRQKMQIASDAAGSMAGIANALYIASNKQNKAAFIAWKTFSIARALINTYTAASEALKNPPGPPLSLVWVAMAIAAGMAQVNAIMRTQPGGATTATAVTGGGGYAYQDPNNPSWQKTQTEEMPKSQVINVHVYGNIVDHDAFARELVPAIQKAAGDGVQ